MLKLPLSMVVVVSTFCPLSNRQWSSPDLVVDVSTVTSSRSRDAVRRRPCFGRVTYMYVPANSDVTNMAARTRQTRDEVMQTLMLAVITTYHLLKRYRH